MISLDHIPYQRDQILKSQVVMWIALTLDWDKPKSEWVIWGEDSFVLNLN